MAERCLICGCIIHREGDYAQPTVKGRSHATSHHFVAERFFRRTKNRKKGKTKPIPVFVTCPWDVEGKAAVFCYECHEELVHNPVLLPKDLERLAALVRNRGLDEDAKTADRRKIGERVKLLHEAIARGLAAMLAETP